MIDQRANGESEDAGAVALTVPDKTIAGTEEATTLSVTADNADTITLTDLWTDWTVTVPDAAGAATTDRVSDAGELVLEWDSVQGSVEPSINIDPPADTYVGGTYAVDVIAEGADSAATKTATIDITPQKPYGDEPATIPGTVEAEDFDLGGQGVAYSDNELENKGGEYRPDEGVDIAKVSDSYYLNWMRSEEWLEYTVDATAGTYDVTARVASAGGGGSFRLVLGGETLCTVEAPGTGDWTGFTTTTLSSVSVPAADAEQLRLEVVEGDFNLDWIRFESPQDKLRWSNPATWGGEKPQAGDAVTVTEEMDVLLDESPPELAGIHIDGGSLTFARQDLDVTTGYIAVTDRGRLQIGTEDEPFEQEATITLTGTRDDIGSGEVPTGHGGVKTIFSLGGKLSIHGAVDGPTWTQLDATAEAGDETLTLEESVGWDAGDEIVVTSTSYDPALAERRTITGVDGNTVTLDESLAFQHYGEMQYFGENDEYSLDERAEVMHLSRNVVIQGDEQSDEDNFGGHVMAMNEHHPEQMDRANNGEDWLDLWEEMPNDTSLVPEVDGVEFNRMGQEGVLARYPFHWHTYGDASGSYVRNCAFHDSYQRGVTIHGTQNATVDNNVAYDVIGHCYFMEDGTEWGNEITNNIGALVRPFTSLDRALVRDDEIPSVFWWIHPDNEFTGNVAAGAFGFGFWLDARPKATGLTGTDRINPGQGIGKGDPNVEFGTFDNNTAHSTVPVARSPDAPRFDERDDVNTHLPNTGGVGLQAGGHRRGDPTPWNVFKGGNHADPDSPRCDFTNNTYYYNNNAGAWFNSGHSYARSVGSTFADNGLGGRWGIAHEEDNRFVALSDNLGNPGNVGMGTVETDQFAVHKSISVEDMRGWEQEVGRSIPAKHSLGHFNQGLDVPLEISGMDWQYDGAITRGNVFVGYDEDTYDETGYSEYFDLGAMTMPGGALAFVTLQNEMIDSKPYLPHENQQGFTTVFKDVDGTLTGKDGYAEIREDPGESPDTSALYDETCSPRDDGRYYVSDAISAEFDVVEVDDSDATVRQKRSGIEAKDELPAGRYEVDKEVTDTIKITGHTITGDASWVFEVDMDRPLSTDPVDSGNQKRLTDPDRVTRVSSMDALNDTAETEVTLYYDEQSNTEHVKIRGGFSYDEDPEEFFYYDGSEGPPWSSSFRGMMRVKLEVSSG